MISLISLFAIVNGALIQIIMASRFFYGMSRRGWLPAILGQVSQRTRTPVIATLLVTSLIMLVPCFYWWLNSYTGAEEVTFIVLNPYDSGASEEGISDDKLFLSS